MNREELATRMRQFALRVIKLAKALPKDRVGDVLGRQVLRSGTSIGANYTEAIRASSRRHFITNLEIVQRETAETLYWLDLITDAKLVTPGRVKPMHNECQELLAIVTATITTTKRGTAATNQKSEIKNQKSLGKGTNS